MHHIKVISSLLALVVALSIPYIAILETIKGRYCTAGEAGFWCDGSAATLQAMIILGPLVLVYTAIAFAAWRKTPEKFKKTRDFFSFCFFLMAFVGGLNLVLLFPAHGSAYYIRTHVCPVDGGLFGWLCGFGEKGIKNIMVFFLLLVVYPAIGMMVLNGFMRQPFSVWTSWQAFFGAFKKKKPLPVLPPEQHDIAVMYDRIFQHVFDLARVYVLRLDALRRGADAESLEMPAENIIADAQKKRILGRMVEHDGKVLVDYTDMEILWRINGDAHLLFTALENPDMRTTMLGEGPHAAMYQAKSDEFIVNCVYMATGLTYASFMFGGGFKARKLDEADHKALQLRQSELAKKLVELLGHWSPVAFDSDFYQRKFEDMKPLLNFTPICLGHDNETGRVMNGVWFTDELAAQKIDQLAKLQADGIRGMNS